MSVIEKRLEEMGIVLPEAPKPVAAYVTAVICGNLVFISGQDCRVNGVLLYEGKVDRDLTVEEGYKAARQCMLNLLAALKQHIGDLDRVKRIVKLLGFVNSADDFNKQPFVMNGASELLVEIFGENGRHARSAIGVNELPFNTPVEVEMIVEII